MRQLFLFQKSNKLFQKKQLKTSQNAQQSQVTGLALWSATVILGGLFILSPVQSEAQSSSSELTCRNKAKEIAAETYKNCMTEQRQSQIEKIRKDYKNELSQLKSRYDKELKKISSGKSSDSSLKNSDKPVDKGSEGETEELKSSTENKPKSNHKVASKNMRPSGARNLPAKKTTVKTEVIDLSSPPPNNSAKGSQSAGVNMMSSDANAEAAESESSISEQSQNRLKNEPDSTEDVEIVELPTQQ